MALALGLGIVVRFSSGQCASHAYAYQGSLFNHSQQPNVTYTLDSETESIRYTTTRKIEEGEELCIFYGHKLWFDVLDAGPSEFQLQEPDDGWGGLTGVETTEDDSSALDRLVSKYADGNPHEVVNEGDLPFTRIKLYRDDEEDELSAVRTRESTNCNARISQLIMCTYRTCLGRRAP